MFCRIYTTGKNITTDMILSSISNLLEKSVTDNSYIEGSGYSISVRSNDEYDQEKEKQFPDGFLNFKIFIEFDFEEQYEKGYYAKLVDKILKLLWNQKYPAIASCEFEELLLQKGGYKSREVPWVG